MQNVNRLSVTNGINRAPCVPAAVSNHFKHGALRRSPSMLGRWVGFTLLGSIKSLSDVPPDSSRKTPQNSSLDPTQVTGRSIPALYTNTYTSIRLLRVALSQHLRRSGYLAPVSALSPRTANNVSTPTASSIA